MNFVRRACTGVAVLLLLAPLVRASDIEITYLANEGVLIKCEDEKILVDALFRDSLDEYPRHNPEVQEKIETGQAPFDGVRFALATHFHLDHWDAGAITRFLRSNPDALFVSTPQATAMKPYSQRKQWHTMWPGPKQSQAISDGHLNIRAFRLNHGAAQNLGYRLSLCGKTLFHLGDADGSAADFSTLRSMGRADVALVPFWWLLETESLAFLRSWKPRHVVALHFGRNEEREAEMVRSRWQEIWVCWNQGETRRF